MGLYLATNCRPSTPEPAPSFATAKKNYDLGCNEPKKKWILTFGKMFCEAALDLDPALHHQLRRGNRRHARSSSTQRTGDSDANGSAANARPNDRADDAIAND